MIICETYEKARLEAISILSDCYNFNPKEITIFKRSENEWCVEYKELDKER